MGRGNVKQSGSFPNAPVQEYTVAQHCTPRQSTHEEYKCDHAKAYT